MLTMTDMTNATVQMEIEEAALKKETDKLSQDRLAALQRELAELRDTFNTKKAQWDSEKHSVETLSGLREQIETMNKEIEKALIANGKKDHILTDLIAQSRKEPENICCIAEGDTPCTFFVPSTSEISSIKKWIAHSEGFAKGAIHLNEGASTMMQEEKAASILPVGVTQVDGEFEYHDIISIIDNAGNIIGVGRSDYSSEEARRIAGQRNKKPIVHYDYLYLE